MLKTNNISILFYFFCNDDGKTRNASPTLSVFVVLVTQHVKSHFDKKRYQWSRKGDCSGNVPLG